jgi:hypothetical protein
MVLGKQNASKSEAVGRSNALVTRVVLRPLDWLSYMA